MSDHDDGNYGDSTTDDTGWLCSCGHYNDHDFHCDECTAEPPWGCDCDNCTEFNDEDSGDYYEPEDDGEFVGWDDYLDHEPDWRV